MNKEAIIDDLRTFYQEFGKGNNYLILLHGWGQSHAFWKDVVERFEKDYHVYVLDLPGFGLTQEPPTTWKITDYAKFIHSFVIKQKITKPILIGHSFGGRIAIVYASQFAVNKLILYSTGGGVPEKSLLKFAHRYIFVKIGKYIFPNFIYRTYTEIFKPKVYQNKIIINKKRSRRMLDVYSQPVMNLEENLQKISTSTLIISGKKDFITNPRIGHTIHKIISGSKLVEISKATHFAHLESPEIFFAAVEKFLRRN